MDPYVTGAAVKALREQRGLTQLQLAERLSVSDKAISKWETGRGYPDITLLEPLADALYAQTGHPEELRQYSPQHGRGGRDLPRHSPPPRRGGAAG